MVELSIIIPVYNAEKFILESLENIQSQNLNDFEMIYVNNNSKDNSEKIIRELANKYDYVKYINEPKQGAASARNNGVQVSKGTYIYFYDVDDILFPGSLNFMLSKLKSNPNIDSVFGKMSPDLDIQIDLSKVSVQERPKGYWGKKWFEQFSTLTGTPSFMHRKDSIIKTGLFPSNLLTGEDAAFHIEIGLKNNLLFIDLPIYHYRRHYNSTIAVSKRQESTASRYLNQHINHFIPKIYNDENMLELKVTLQKRVIALIAKLLTEKQGIKERFHTYRMLQSKIIPIKLDLIERLLIYILILSNIKFVRTILLTRYLKLKKK